MFKPKGCLSKTTDSELENIYISMINSIKVVRG